MTIDRQEIAEIFRQAKKVLAKNRSDCDYRFNGGSPHEEFICHAIERVGRYSYYRDPALAVIQSRLGDVLSLESWVIRNVPSAGYPVDKDEMQAYRHRWLDALIEEFSQ